MKGVVFTEFFGMVGDVFSDDMVDDLIDATDPASGGAYTAVGTYDHGEIVAMVVELSARTGTPVPDLLQAFKREAFAAILDEEEPRLKADPGLVAGIRAEVERLAPAN